MQPGIRFGSPETALRRREKRVAVARLDMRPRRLQARTKLE